MTDYTYPEPKYYFLNIKENRDLLNSIQTFISSNDFDIEFNKFFYEINEVTALLPESNFIKFKISFLDNLVVIIDKILLVNIYYYKYNNKINEGLTLLSNGNFHHGISIDRYYVICLFEILTKYFDVKQIYFQDDYYYNGDQKDEICMALQRLITNAINAFFSHNKESVYAVIVSIFDAFFQQVGYINPKWYKFELFSPSKPILVFEERVGEI